MEGREHLIFTTIFLIIVYFICPTITITNLLEAWIYGIVPDVDLKFKKRLGHRNIVFHSIIPWIFVFIFNPFGVNALILGAVGLHLLLDLQWHKHKQKGFYTIKITPKKGLNGRVSTFWLLINGILGIILCFSGCLL